MQTLLLTFLVTSTLTINGELLVNGSFEKTPEHNYGWTYRTRKTSRNVNVDSTRIKLQQIVAEKDAMGAIDDELNKLQQNIDEITEKAQIANADPYHELTPYYLDVHSLRSVTVCNSGENGLQLRNKEVLKFSCYCKSSSDSKIILLIIGDDGKIIGGKTFRVSGNGWQEINQSLQVNKACNKGRLEIVFPQGDFQIDEVSLVRAKTLNRR